MGNGTIPCFDHARNDDRGFLVGNSRLQQGWVLSPTSALRTPGCQARDSGLQFWVLISQDFSSNHGKKLGLYGVRTIQFGWPRNLSHPI